MKNIKLLFFICVLYSNNVNASFGGISCEDALKHKKIFTELIFYGYIDGFRLGLIFGMKDASEQLDFEAGIDNTTARLNSKLLWSPIKENLEGHSNEAIGLMVRDYCRLHPTKKVWMGVRRIVTEIGYSFTED